jgi:hypothetical protein
MEGDAARRLQHYSLKGKRNIALSNEERAFLLFLIAGCPWIPDRYYDVCRSTRAAIENPE